MSTELMLRFGSTTNTNMFETTVAFRLTSSIGFPTTQTQAVTNFTDYCGLATKGPKRQSIFELLCFILESWIWLRVLSAGDASMRAIKAPCPMVDERHSLHTSCNV
jgi:hypothetical protein